MLKPPILVSIEPEENGKLVYLAVAPMAAGQAPTNMLAFRLRMTNNGDATERLNKINVVLLPAPGQPGNPQPLVFNFDRAVAIASGNTAVNYIAPEDSISMSALPPAQIRISLFFDGHDEPVVLPRQLAKHKSPTPQQSYRFPGDTRDMRLDEYFTQKHRHTGGSQHFGHDIVVYGWNEEEQEFTRTRPGTSGDRNEHYFGYDKPLYAMADGTVISFANDREENPIPGERALIRLADKEAGPVGALSLARLSNSRMATAVRTQAGKLKIIIWETTPEGDILDLQLARLGDVEGEPISHVASVPLSDAGAADSSRLLTAVRTAAGRLKLIVWNISADGMIITRLGEDEAGIVGHIAVATLTSRRIAVAVRTAEGNLKVIIWDISTDGLTLTRVGDEQAGAIKKVAVTTLSDARLFTIVQTSGDKLKVIVWDVAPHGAVMRRGDAEADSVLDVAVGFIKRSGAQRVGTAVRTGDGKLKVTVWEIDSNGNVDHKDELEAGEVAAVKAAQVTKEADDLGTCVITKAGTLKVNDWKYKDEKLRRYSENSAGVTDLMDLVWLKSDDDPFLLVTAVRTGSGNLKLIAWWLVGGGGNHFYLLHGDELVLYAHMIKGSLNPALCQLGASVKQGQFLGKLGNSGASSGPHVHIHASQAPKNMTVEQMIQADQEGTLGDLVTYRPLPFHNAQAMRLSDVKAGILADNKFAVVNDQGFYWERMAIWPGLSTPGIPTGRSEVAFHGVESSDYQELFDKVTGAHYRLVWIDGYAVGNDLRFNVLFRPEDGSDWSAHHNLNGGQYQGVYDDHKQNGKRLVHVNSYQVGNEVLYAAIFRDNDGVLPSAYHGVSAEGHQAKFESLKANGFAPVNVSVVSINGQRRYTALYEKRSVGGFLLKSFLTPDQYQAEFDAHKDDGLQIAYLDTYQHDGGVRFSTIWDRAHKGVIHARHDLTGSGYQQEYETTTGDGFLTAIVVGYALNNQHRFAGVWRK